MACKPSDVATVLAAPRISEMWGNRESDVDETVNRAFFTMDWWFAAAPAVVATWMDIDRKWDEYVRALQMRHIHNAWAHWAWAAHIHLFLNASASVRFLDLANNLGRFAFEDLLSGTCQATYGGRAGAERFQAVALPSSPAGAPSSNRSNWAACAIEQAGAHGKLLGTQPFIGRCDALRVGAERKRLSIREHAESSWRPRHVTDLQSGLRVWAARQCPFASQLPIAACANKGRAPIAIAFDCTTEEMLALEETRRFAEEAILLDDSAAVESLLVRLPYALDVNASAAVLGYCKDVPRGSGDCEAGDEGSWGIKAQSDDEMARACLGMCAACPRCQYVSYSRVHNDCTWLYQCNLDTLRTDVKGFTTQKMIRR